MIVVNDISTNPQNTVRFVEKVNAPRSFPVSAKCSDCGRAYLINSQSQLEGLECKCERNPNLKTAQSEAEAEPISFIQVVCLVVLIAIAVAGAAHYFSLPELTKY